MPITILTGDDYESLMARIAELERRAVPSQADIDDLTRRVEALEAEHESDEPGPAPPPPEPEPEPEPEPTPDPQPDDPAPTPTDPKLHYFNSLVPPSGVDPDLFYGKLAKGGDPNNPSNRLVDYDPEQQAMRQRFEIGDHGIPISNQTLCHWGRVSPSNASLCSVSWQFKTPNSGWRGGKMFQIVGGASRRLHFEIQCKTVIGSFGQLGWGAIPGARVYFTERVGGRGVSTWLCGGSHRKTDPDYCSGQYTCPAQPALGPRTLKSNYTWADHVGNGGDQYLIGDEDTSGWITFTVTFDWREPLHRVWMHVEDEHTPRTLVNGEGDKGFPLVYKPSDTPVGGLWVEFNNSKTRNDSESHSWVRNVKCVRDAFAWEVE